jgi:hypothetical protein
MTKKSRRSRLKHKRRGSPKPLAVKEAGQRPQSLPLPPKQAPAARPPITVAERSERYQYVLSDLKRALVIAGALLLLLIALSFFLR